jgi:(1->4)-alpha-D-glucan 1-alpha-D-glucosylmutase
VSKIRSSTYRLQFHGGFTYADATAIADYIRALGISHIYSSPGLQTAPGSTHGYDVTDFKSVNRELGGEEVHAAFLTKLRDLDLGHLLDIVPNHMSLAQNNPYWRDVLENGPESKYADYFDLDWTTGEARMRNKVLLPILGDQYGVVLKNGDIKLTRNETHFEVTINSTRLPVAPCSLSGVLGSAAQAMSSDTLAFLSDSLSGVSYVENDSHAARRKVQRNSKVLLSLLTRYIAERPESLSTIDNAIASVNSSVDALDEFLQQQHYRLAYWKAANQDLGYRRFFDVNTLIGVRVEREEVFEDTHALILEWLRTGAIDGVRVDHADGLRDPQCYLARLRQRAPEAWIVVEKILARNECFRDSWPVQGTTGYDFLNMVLGLFVSPSGLGVLDEIYQRVLGAPVDYPALVHDAKIAVLHEALGSDVNWLSSLFVDICEQDREHRDHTRADIRHAVREVASCFSVYRTYISPQRNELTELDAAIIHNAVELASQFRPDIDRGLFTFIEDVLLLRKRGVLETDFLLRFQQFTGPVMAKGFEDTSLYRYNRLIGVNDVGSNPCSPVVSIEDFHRYNEQTQKRFPEGLVALSTHDTKRGEDARARLVALSEMPQQFGEAVERWYAMNGKYRLNGAPDPNTEYFYYQTLIGSWPLSEERATRYMEKAARESKEKTSWTKNNHEFEDSLKKFIHDTLADKDFCKEVETLVKLLDATGRRNSLAQTLLKCTVPGVPDLYQGSELWDHRLVDPDNREPVDYELRRRLLSELKQMDATKILEQMESGLPKLWVIHSALEARRRYPECFGPDGEYAPLYATGSGADHVVSFLRGDRVATVVPRLTADNSEDWNCTTLTLPQGKWTNVLSDQAFQGGDLKVGDLLAAFPVALLTKEN